MKKTILNLRGPLRVRILPNGRTAELLWPYKVRLKDKTSVIVPAGFVTDFASVPRPLWSILPPWGKYSPAAVVHDYLCRKPGFPRKRADKIFLELMKALGVPFWKRHIMYRGVRMGALFSKRH